LPEPLLVLTVMLPVALQIDGAVAADAVNKHDCALAVVANMHVIKTRHNW